MELYRGDSFTLGIKFNDEYNIERIQELELNIGSILYGKLSDNSLDKDANDVFVCKIPSEKTMEFYGGNYKVTLHIQDEILGVKKQVIGSISVNSSNNKTNNESINTLYDALFVVAINETQVTVEHTFRDIIKGDPLLFSDLTPMQIAELQRPATEAILSIQAVESAVSGNEGLRVQAELKRQLDTSTAISNAEKATDDANEKAELANNAALLANEKAGLAETATTQANAARDGANSAAQEATNLVNSYATELADKAEHGYLATETKKTVKELDANLVQLAGDVKLKLKNIALNGDFENGFSATKGDGFGAISELTHNVLNPISGLKDARLKILTAGSSSGRPILTLPFDKSDFSVGDLLYMKFDYKVNNGNPIIKNIHNGGTSESINRMLVGSGKFAITLRNSAALTNLGLMYLNGDEIWEFQLDNVVILNLSKIFGIGNEPSLAEFERMLNLLGISYFDELNLTSEQVFKWIGNKSDIIQENWITPTLINGWVQTPDHSPISYMKDNFGFVHLRGRVQGGQLGATVFNIPGNYFPSDHLTFPIITNNAFGYLHMTKNGYCYIYGSNVWADLGEIIFKAK